MFPKPVVTLSLLLALAFVSACASTAPAPHRNQPDRLDALDTALRRAQVRDASLQVLDSHVWARADVRSVTHLEQALEASDRAAKVEHAAAFLRQAAEDGRRAFELELARLSAAQVAELAGASSCDPPSAESPRECLRRLYEQESQAQLDAHLTELRALPDAAAADAWLQDLRHDLRPSIKTRGRIKRRALTAPLFPFVYAWRKIQTAQEYEGPQPVDFPQVRLYRPAAYAQAGMATEEDMELLERWAPILVQEVVPDPPYPAWDDRIGRLYLEAGPHGPIGAVDVEQPASYAYVDVLRAHGRELTQLVYTFWYPEHPKLHKGVDFEHGRIEGLTLRITLDPGGTPRLFETIYNCGCYHRLFVDRELEAQARAVFGPPEETRPYSIQRHLEGKIDWIVPELVEVTPAARPLFFVRAGFHLPASIKFAPPPGLELETAPSETYALAPYRELEILPFENRPVGLFDDTGLVRGAHRLEGKMLSPLGLYHAGHPRQRGTQLIHFDQADFDDPALYDTYLRLPEAFWQGDSAASRTTVRTAADGGAESGEPVGGAEK